MATQRFIQKNLNRVASGLVVAGDVPTSFCAVSLRCDSSQQFNIYGVQFGYAFVLDADRTNARGGYCVGILDYTSNPDTDNSFASVVPSTQFGEQFFLDYVKMDQNQPVAFDDISNPIVINGDRRVTFILSPPSILGGAAGSMFIYLLVRGEITQIKGQERPTLGQWEIR